MNGFLGIIPGTKEMKIKTLKVAPKRCKVTVKKRNVRQNDKNQTLTTTKSCKDYQNDEKDTYIRIKPRWDIKKSPEER